MVNKKIQNKKREDSNNSSDDFFVKSWIILAVGFLTFGFLVFSTQLISPFLEPVGLSVSAMGANINVSFVSPTSLNNTNVYTDYLGVFINITDADNLDNFVFNWNGNNFTYYDDSLVLILNLDNVSALGEDDATVKDFSQYDNSGQIINSSYNSSGKYGSSLDFDGSTTFVNISNSASLNIENEITVSAWINANEWETNSHEGTIIGKDDWHDSDAHGYVLRTGSNGKLSFVIAKDNSNQWPEALTTSVMSADTWHHVAGTFNGTHLIAYVDGDIEKTTIIPYTLIETSTYTLELGRSPFDDARQFNGLIDEVRVWNRSLSEEELQQVYLSNLRKYDSGEWEFYINETDLTIGNTYNYSGYVIDASSNSDDTGIRINILASAQGVPEFSDYALMLILVIVGGCIYKRRSFV